MKPSAKLLVWPDEDRDALELLMEGTPAIAPGRRAPARTFLPKVPDLAERARTLVAQRRMRRLAFGDDAGLFQDPAWAIMLELYLVPARRPLAVSNVAFSIDIPMSTTLRWLRKLEERALLHSTADPIDARVRRITLSQKAIDIMEAYFSGL